MAAILIAALMAAATSAPPPAFTFEAGRATSEWRQPPATYPGGVTAIGDFVYSQPLHYRPLRLDLYRPPADGKPRPLIVHVHGGAWLTGTKRNGGPIKDFPAVLAQFAARGFVVASVEYRLDGEAKFPAAIQDVKAAIRFLRDHASDYGINPAHVGIFGGSAGGQLAALAGTSCGVAALDPPAPDTMGGTRPAPAASTTSTCVQAAAPWYGVHDFVTIPIPAGGTGPAPYLGCASFNCPPETLRFASPVTYIDRKDPPFLLIHGLADKLVAVSQTQELEARLKAAGVPVKALYIPDVDHGLVGKTDQITHDANLQALEATLEFFTTTLGARP